MEYIKTQFLISLEIKNHEIFLKNLGFKPQASSPQATSNKPRAGGTHNPQANL
jgi:hypothetical protein